MILKSTLDNQSSEFISNKKQNLLLAKELESCIKRVKVKSLSSKRSKLTLSARLELIKDPGTEFLELSSLAAWGQYKDEAPGAGLFTGVGQVSGRPCMIIANNPEVKGGSYFPETVKKHLRAQEIALENRMPCLYLVDSGGAYLPLQSEVFPDKDHFGRIFYNQAHLSAQGLAQIAVVLGSCTAGGAYLPAMADENIIVENQGTIFLGGPPLVEAATGEVVTDEELGGGVMHARVSGVCDHLEKNEHDALLKARQIISRLGQVPKKDLDKEVKEPLYPAEELYGVVDPSLKKPFDMREILARILDGSEFDEFKKEYGKTLLTGWGYLCGRRVGILANNGVMFVDSANKGTHFIDLCDQRNIPILFLQNITGFMIGKKYEREGIAKAGAKMVTAVSLARVPKITLMIGGSFGAGNYGLCGRAYQPRFLFTWPSSRISVMGGEQAAQVLSKVKKSKDQDVKKLQQDILKKYKEESSPYYSTSRLWDDGIIDPLQTRKCLAMALDVSYSSSKSQKRKGIYRI